MQEGSNLRERIFIVPCIFCVFVGVTIVYACLCVFGGCMCVSCSSQFDLVVD